MKKRFFQKMFAFVFALTMLGSILCGAAVIPLNKETEAPAPFALSDVRSVTYRNGSGQQITITNRPMLEQFVALMNAAGAKPSQVNPNLPNGIGFAVRGQGWEIGYTLGSLPQDVQERQIIFTSQGAYQVQNGKTIIKFLEDALATLDPYGCFAMGRRVQQLRILDNQKRQAALLDYDRENDFVPILESLELLEPQKVEKDQLGLPLAGASELRIETIGRDSKEYSYQLYQYGVAVQSNGEEVGSFLCDLPVRKQLYREMQSVFDGSSKHASWMSLARAGRIRGMEVMVDGKVVEEGVTHLENWKGLRVGSVTEREALWTAPELECRIHFVTGVDYRVQILNGKLRIWASDMPQVLEYTIGDQQQEALLVTLQNA